MNRHLLRLAASFVLLLAASLPTSAAEGVAVRYPSGDETVEGYLVAPPGRGPFPASSSSTNGGA